MRAKIDRPSRLWRAFVLTNVPVLGVLSVSDDAWQAWEDKVTHRIPRSTIRALFVGTVGLHVFEALIVRRMARRAGVGDVGAWTRTALLYGFPTFFRFRRAADVSSPGRGVRR
jgi:hypothetical protein